MKIELSEKIKAWRNARGLSQEQAAQALGVAHSTLTKWEQGRSKTIHALHRERVEAAIAQPIQGKTLIEVFRQEAATEGQP